MLDMCLECSVKLIIESVACPGLRFPPRSALYIEVQLFDRSARTYRASSALPPLNFDEEFHFSKIYCGRRDFVQICNLLYDELVILRLIQKLDGSETTLAIYENSLGDFLFPGWSRNRSLTKVWRCGDVEHGHVFLRSTPFYPSKLQPKLKFCARTTIQVTSAHACCGCCTLTIAPRKRRAINGLRFDSVVGDHDQIASFNWMAVCDNRPAFVVRRVDSTLLGRIPSLYRQLPGRKTYCCISPHRYDDCAACRVSSRRIRSPSPLRRNRRRTSSVPAKPKEIPAVIQNTRVGRRRQRTDSNNGMDTELYRNNNKSDSEDRITSAPIQLSDIRSPQQNPWMSNRATTPPPPPPPPPLRPQMERHDISPILRSPTFKERFGKLPEDAIIRRPRANSADRNCATPVRRRSSAADRIKEPHDEYHIHCKEPIFHGVHRRPCCSGCGCCSHQCSNTCCSSYWMSRLGPPITSSPYNWYSFRHDLACAYDDYYRKLYDC